ncbi:MAG: MoxR family ATPase [Microbacteriaceae bacterium]|nr:MoxR family ATPase [Microbacteriaceae bacterium]
MSTSSAASPQHPAQPGPTQPSPAQPSPLSDERATWAGSALRTTADAMEQMIHGKRRVIELVLAAQVARGHVLLEDVPGTGKTALARTLAQVMQGSSSRIQFTPDLLPGDVTGITVYDQRQGIFEFHAGPIFANVVLADEINRASPKTQSALLEVMEEGQVTVDGKSHPVGTPFMVIATQNPVEQAGTYRLPEAQLDRFMIKTSIGYPDETAMRRILQQHATPREVQPVMNTGTLLQLQEFAAQVYVSPLVVDYLTRLVEASRSASEVRLGASVRGALALQRMATAWALVQGRSFVVPDDVRSLATAALTHRLVLEPEAEFDGVTAEQVIARLLLDVAEPTENGTA